MPAHTTPQVQGTYRRPVRSVALHADDLPTDDGATVDDDDGIDAALMQLPIVTIKIDSVLQLLSIVCSLESTLTFQ